MSDFDPRPGEVRLPNDPAQAAGDAHLVFIGRIRSPWKSRADCPRNLRIARERGQPAELVLDAPYRPGLAGLQAHGHAVLLYWMHEARRDLIVQRPRHATEPIGTFALRSPVRPNPIALAVVRIMRIDAAAGLVTIDAIDCIDGTPLVDIKPYIPTVDGAF